MTEVAASDDVMGITPPPSILRIGIGESAGPGAITSLMPAETEQRLAVYTSLHSSLLSKHWSHSLKVINSPLHWVRTLLGTFALYCLQSPASNEL